MHDLILKQFYLNGALIIKIFLFIILILFIIIIVFSLIKINYLFSFIQGLENFFNNFGIIADRFSLLIYYFNIFRTLIIFHDEKLKNNIKNIMDNINEDFEKENNEYKYFLTHHSSEFKTLKKLLNNLTYTNANSTGIISETVCFKEKECLTYLKSKYNIFDAGFYFSYKSCFAYIDNYYKDYKGLSNKKNIEDIKSTFINGNHTSFNSISLSISHLIYFVKIQVHRCFQNDQYIFLSKSNELLTILNLISIVFSFCIILFINVIVFITISGFSKPIKESAYRINCSFYYIKKYKVL
jgi:hypothetical protein